ncbi:kinase-like domain-containing protein [Mycena amicta]|nr:kinase-like domain-containing protein [Mycena amicta]
MSSGFSYGSSGYPHAQELTDYNMEETQPMEEPPKVWGRLLLSPNDISEKAFTLKKGYFDLMEREPSVTFTATSTGNPEREILFQGVICSRKHVAVLSYDEGDEAWRVQYNPEKLKMKIFVGDREASAETVVADKDWITFRPPASKSPSHDPPASHIGFRFHNLATPGRKLLTYYNTHAVHGVPNTLLATLKTDTNVVYTVKARRAPRNHEQLVITEISFLEGLSEAAPSSICRLHDYFFNQDGTYDIILKPFAGGPLADLIEKRDGLSERMTKGLIEQLCNGVKYLHSNLIVNGNLNLTTVMVTDWNQSDVRAPRLQITDFGQAKRVDPDAVRSDEVYYDDRQACGIIAWKCMEGNKLSIFIGEEDADRDFECELASTTLNITSLHSLVVGFDKEGYRLWPSDAVIRFIRALLNKPESGPMSLLMDVDNSGPMSMADAVKDPWLKENALRYPAQFGFKFPVNLNA